MTDVTPFERDLARALDGYLGPRRQVDARAVSRAAVVSATSRPRRGLVASLAGGQRLVWLALVALTLLAVLAIAVAGGSTPRPSDAPSAPPVQTNPAVVVQSPVATPTSAAGVTYTALLIRDAGGGAADLFAALPDGREQLIRHLTPLSLTSVDTDLPGDHWNMSPYAEVSSNGWLAMQVSSPDAYAFFDLKDPSRKPWLLPYWAAVGGAWSPNGLFAALDTGSGGSPLGTLIVDPAAHTIAHLTGEGAIGGGPTVYWAADGSGLLGQSELYPGVTSVFPIDNGPPVPGLVPVADRRGTRYFGANGTTLCGAPVDEAACPADVSVGMVATDGTVTKWSIGATLVGGLGGLAISFDGRTLWALVVQGSPGQGFAISHVLTPATARMVTTFTAADLPDPSAGASLGFAGLAPDDSITVLSEAYGPTDNPKIGSVVVPTDGSTAHGFDASFAGFVPTSVLGDWPAVP